MSGWRLCPRTWNRAGTQAWVILPVAFCLPRLQGVLAVGGSQQNPLLGTPFGRGSSLTQGAAYVRAWSMSRSRGLAPGLGQDNVQGLPADSSPAGLAGPLLLPVLISGGLLRKPLHATPGLGSCFSGNVP